ncbi:MAG: hypothetical protein AAF790_05915 [Planctomycetota bacterium]
MLELSLEMPEWLLQSLASSGAFAALQHGTRVAWSRLPGRGIYQLRTATPEELRLVQLRLADYVAADRVRSLEELAAIGEARPDVYRVLQRWDSTQQKFGGVVGVAIVYPLKKAMAQRLLSGGATARQIGAGDVHRRPTATPHAWYLGFAWAEDKVSQGYLCAALADALAPPAGATVKLITRPTTEPSLRFAHKHGFQPVGGPTDGPSGRPVELLQVCSRDLPIGKLPRRVMVQAVR